MGPSIRACTGHWVIVQTSPELRGRAPLRSSYAAGNEGRGRTYRLPWELDVHGLQRRKAVERHRGVGRSVGAGALDQHLVADLEAHGQLVRVALVQHVGRV